MSEQAVRIDPHRRLADQPGSGHNRWHEEIEPLLEVASGEPFVLECRSALDGQLGNGATAADVPALDFDLMHPLSGPVRVTGAEPGDLLEVRIHALEPDPWGGHAVSAVAPGFGVLFEDFVDPFLVHWDIDASGAFATSADLPGVRIPNRCFAGTVGVAPARADRERALVVERAFLERGIGVPQPGGKVVPPVDAVRTGGLRTLPPRQVTGGGNVDVRQATAGATLLIPVRVPGALLSAGDCHFAQGDGEICGTALEMRGRIRLSATVRPRAAARSGQLRIERGPDPARPGIAAVGRGVSEEEAAREAVRGLLDQLEQRGYTRLQGYVICTAAGDLCLASTEREAPVVLATLPDEIFVDR